MISAYTYSLLVASKVQGIGKKTLHALARDRMFFELELDSVWEHFPELRTLRKGSSVWNEATSKADRDVGAAEARGHFILSSLDAKYPKLLKHIIDRPEILYVNGNPERFSERAIAVVGTREPTRHGIVTAARITSFFAENEWQIVSGLATGIDSVAHQTTLENQGSTVGVLAQGLDSIYPKENKILAEKMVEEGGLLVSEYGYGSRTFPSNFVERDRIQAALARCVVMVQSDEAGGSWHASRAALRYGRHLVIPRPTNDDQVAGEGKIRGNMKIINAPKDEKIRFLKCGLSDLSRVIVIEGKAEYLGLMSTLELACIETQGPKTS
jgi:DNA processing protein